MTPAPRLPVMKVIWGAFALPGMYRDTWFRAVAIPLLLLIGVSLLWNVFDEPGETFERGLWYVAWLAATSWLAVRCHRLVLLDPDQLTTTPSQAARIIGVYLATAALLWMIWFVICALLAAIAVSVFMMVSADGIAIAGTGPRPPPAPDPEIQAWINRITVLASLPGAYVVSRLSLLLPAVALERPWSPRTAWELSSRNGWRLAIVVFAMPWLFSSFIDLLIGNGAAPLETGLLAVLLALLTSLEVTALSLSFRELERHAPPPTDPPG